MLLSHLPPDGFRPIVGMLDFESLVLLNATFDRRIQRLISTRSMAHTVRIGYINDPKDGALRYLLRNLHDVRRLVLETDACFEEKNLPLLAFNPLEVVLQSNSSLTSHMVSFKHMVSFNKSLMRYHGAAEELGYEEDCPIPWFALLTPRLETLSISSKLCDFGGLPSDLRPFPTTLTAFRMTHKPCPLSLLLLLPPSILSMVIYPFIGEMRWMSTLSTNFPRLQTLSLSTPFPAWFHPISGPSTLPKSLQTFTLTRFVFSAHAWDALRLLLAKCSHLHTVAIDSLEPNAPAPSSDQLEPISLSDILPKSVLHFSYLHSTRAELLRPHWLEITFIPPSLVSLSIMVRDDFKLLRMDLNSHSSLKALKLRTLRGNGFELISHELPKTEPSFDEPFLLPCNALPPNITELDLETYIPLQDATIRCLPTKLSLLAVTVFDLSLHKVFQERLPTCSLKLTRPMRLWNSPNGAWLTSGIFEPFWSCSDVNMDKWYKQVTDWFSSNRVLCSVDHVLRPEMPQPMRYAREMKSFTVNDTESSLRWAANVQFTKLNNDCPNLEKLDLKLSNSLRIPEFGFRSLTHLDLHDTPIIGLSCQYLPVTLKHLSTSSVIDLSDRKDFTLPALRFLNAPNWTFCPETISTMSQMDTLRAVIAKIRDFEIVNFVTTLANVKKHSNLLISIRYFVTGALLSDRGANAVLHVTRSALEVGTAAALNASLLTKLPSGRLAFGQIDRNLGALPTIGSFVKSLEEDKNYHVFRVCIPQSALSVQLEDNGRLTEISELDSLQDADDELGEKLVGFGSVLQRPPRFSRSLITLDVSECTSNFAHLETSTIRHIRIATTEMKRIEMLFSSGLPPQLVSLVIEWTASAELYNGYPASFLPRKATLPASIEHFALSFSKGVPMETSSDRPDSNLMSYAFAMAQLPALKTFYIPGIIEDDILHYVNCINMKTLEKFIIAPGSRVDRKVLQEYPKIVFEEVRGEHIRELVARMHEEALAAGTSLSQLSIAPPPSISSPTAAFASAWTKNSEAKTSSTPSGFGSSSVASSLVSDSSPDASSSSVFTAWAAPSEPQAMLSGFGSGSAASSARRKAVRRK